MPYEIGEGYEIGAVQVGEYAIGAPIQFLQPRQLAPAGAARVIQSMPQPPQMFAGSLPVRQTVPDKALLVPMGFNTESEVTGPGAGTARVTPQFDCTPRKLVIPDSIAPRFSVSPLFIGLALQSPANAEMPAESFRGDTTASEIKAATCSKNSEISMAVRNKSTVDTQFESTLYCYTIQ